MTESLNKMRELVGTYGPMLGETPEGRDWTLKALHPADQLVTVKGVPDECTATTTLLNWQQVVRITPQAGAAGTWNASVMLLPTPDVFASIKTLDSVGTAVQLVTNQALSIHGPAAATAAMIAGFERWRLAYAGVSVYFDGPTLSDQGSVVAAQYPVEFQEFTPGSVVIPPWEPTAGEPIPYRMAPYHTVAFQADDLPTYSKLQVMPNAYFGQAKSGVYMPLKLSSGYADWHSQRDCVYDASSLLKVADTDTFILPSRAADVVTGTADYPWYGMDNVAIDAYGDTTASAPFLGDLHCAFCNTGVGGICFQNVSVSAGFTLYFRYGFECQCNPTSPFASWLSVSPMYDPAAMRDYFRIVRELKDAYPVEYNDLGKLWEVIKAAAGVVADLSGYGKVLRPIGSGITKVLESAAARTKKVPKKVIMVKAETPPSESRGDLVAAAARDRMRKAVDRAPTPRTGRTPKGVIRLPYSRLDQVD